MTSDQKNHTQWDYTDIINDILPDTKKESIITAIKKTDELAQPIIKHKDNLYNLSSQQIAQIIDQEQTISTYLHKLAVYLQLRFYANKTDQDAASLLSFFEEYTAELSNKLLFFFFFFFQIAEKKA